MKNNSFYKPSGTVKDTNRTYVPDLYRQAITEMQEEDTELQKFGSEPTHIVRLQNRPLIGVLYSISAGIEGELFPVYVGRNTIGRDPSCDICLKETSVSAQHAMLLARKQTNENGQEYINVILSDNNSSYGTIINNERLGFEKVTCSDGDIITIGQNYVLVLSLFNALGKLSIAYGFDRISEQKTDEEESEVPLPSTTNIIGGMLMNPVEDHSSNVTQDVEEDASSDFYKPTKQPVQDHYNNKTIIL